MGKIVNRDGDEVRIVVYDNEGNRKKITRIEELGLSESGEPDLKLILIDCIGKSLKNLDFYALFLLSVIIIKRLLDKEEFRERLVLSKRLLGDYEDYAEITFKGKKITIPINTLDMFINHKILIFHLYIKNQYNVNEKNIKNKVIVDAGANIGLFLFMCAVFGPKRIYAFEPIKETYEILKANIKRNKLESIIIPINKGVGDRNFSTEINYRMGGDTGASIELKERYKNPQKIEVVKLDDFLKDKVINFIKMDIEGYEENALRGSKNIIKKYKPILTFSAYHKPTDKVILPEVVRSIRRDYNIRLYNFADEDFYCE